jgi:hypothetical protein
VRIVPDAIRRTDAAAVAGAADALRAGGLLSAASLVELLAAERDELASAARRAIEVAAPRTDERLGLGMFVMAPEWDELEQLVGGPQGAPEALGRAAGRMAAAAALEGSKVEMRAAHDAYMAAVEKALRLASDLDDIGGGK